MIPSRTWFPTNLQDRVAWYENFNTQIQIVGTSLGLTASDMLVVTSDNTAMKAIGEVTVELEAYKEAVRQYRILITEGNPNDPSPQFPALPTYTAPAGVGPGMFDRLVKLVDRIRVAQTYTPEVGALLGIIPKSTSAGGNTPEADLKPALKASESVMQYKFSTNVTRLGAPAFKIQVQKQGQSTWSDVAFATNNPCEVTITPTNPGEPERILVRALLMKDNSPVGQPSDPTYVTVNP